MPPKTIELLKSVPLSQLGVLTEDRLKKLFEDTPITEVRQRCLEILTGYPSLVTIGSDWVEEMIDQLGAVGDTDLQEKLMEWYITRAGPDVYTRAYRFMMGLSKGPIVFARLANYSLKAHPRLYWASDRLHEACLQAFKGLTDGHNWAPTTIAQWETIERYTRRIVEAHDVAYYELFRDLNDALERGLIKFKQDRTSRSESDPWAPSRVRVFLSDTLQFLKAYQEEQISRDGFARSLLDATFCREDEWKKGGFTDPFDTIFAYCTDCDMGIAVAKGEPVNVTIRINNRWSGNVEPLQRFVPRISIGLDVEGGFDVKASDWSFRMTSGADFNTDSVYSFTFVPLSKRQRATFRFFLDGVHTGTYMMYYPATPRHVWY